MEDWLQWAIAATCAVVTIVLEAEVARLFIGAGAIGVLYYGMLFKGRTPPATLLAGNPMALAPASLCGGARFGEWFCPDETWPILPQGRRTYFRQRFGNRPLSSTRVGDGIRLDE